VIAAPVAEIERVFDTADMAAAQQIHDLRTLVRPTSLAGERILPVVPPLAPLLPAGGLACGTTVQVSGATTVVLGLVAGPSRAGSWVAVVGTGSLGWAAAADLGVDLDRTIVVPDVALGDWGEVTAALVDAVDVVVVAPRHPIRQRDARRLAARARERGSVLVVSSPRFPWPVEPEVSLDVAGRWVGLGDGHGRLSARRVAVSASGRRAAARARTVELWAPAADGSLREALPDRIDHGPADGPEEVVPGTARPDIATGERALRVVG
jgi:hypothetical protein